MIENITIENSTLCGASCIMCPRDKFKHKLEMMPMDVFRRTIAEAVLCGVKNIVFCGYGDPLMDNYLEERFLHIREKCPHIKIFMTNTGQLLEGKKLELVCEFVDVIKISNYGFSKKTYESVHRGSLNYEKIFENIEILLHSNRKPYSIMVFLDLPENHDEIEAWKAHYESLADRIDIWKPHNWAGDYIPQYSPISTSSLIRCFRMQKLYHIFVHAEGSVSICCEDYNRQLVIGNIKAESLAEIINCDLAKKIQKMHEDGSILQSDFICKNCDQIRDRTDALIYTSGNMQVGKISLGKY